MSDTVDQREYTDIHSFGPGEVILFPGAPENLYRVQRGLVRVHTVDDEGNGLTLRYVKPGGFFGEEAIAGLPRRYFAEAVASSEVEVISPAVMDAEDNLELATDLVRAVGGLYRSLHRLSGKRLRSRIAAELLDLRGSALADTNEAGDTVIHITHDDLAAAVGSVRETVTKVVGELARLGSIEAGYGKISLVDPELLSKVAGE
jgi:CRP/FNR family cyclic AMP-dependent transcriptional regulator